MSWNEPRERPLASKGNAALASSGSREAASPASPERFEITLDPTARPNRPRKKGLPSRRARWGTVLALTAAHPALLVVLHPIVGEASNSLLLAGPVVATLLLNLRVGLFFILVNTVVSGILFTRFGMSGEEGRPKAVVSLLVTITVCWGADRLRRVVEQRRAIEEALHQTQKVEAIGRLAAGVAHDINNTLNAIMGSTFALRHELSSFGRPFQDLDNIALACDRGAQLTRNLLGFARKSRSRTQLFPLNRVVRDVQGLLTRAARKSIHLQTELAEPAALVRGDEAQLEHAVLNLCLNALDAMDEEGTLTIATAVDDHTVSVTVADTGSGMDPQVREHAFEPFFTTKAVGKGTGLGLSMVHATVQAMHGTIRLATQVGAGTTITLSFPRAFEVSPALSGGSPSVPIEPRSLAGSTVLVIDDEPLVLRAAVRMFRAMGCEVLSANDGREGLEVFKAHRASISLVVVDLVMPGADGVATLSEVLALAPETRVLLVSGYTPEADRIDTLLRARPTVAYLEKPYDPSSVLTALGGSMVPLAAPPSSTRTGTA